MKILGIGNAIVDILTKVDSDAIIERLKLPKGSMQLIGDEMLNEIFDEIAPYDSIMVAGGAVANTICGLAQLGLTAGYIGRVSDDFYGRFYDEELQRNGVTPFLISHNDEQQTGCAMTFITPDGERTFGTYLGAAAAMRATDLSESMFAGWDLLFIEGYLVQNQDLIRTAARIAKKAGCKIALDMASYNVVRANKSFFEELIDEYVDLVFANEEEAFEFAGCGPEEAVSLIASRCEIAIVKQGARGSYAMRGTEKVHVDALPAHCLDTTGAGDLYAAGFMWAIANDRSLTEATRFGSLIASKVIEVIGPKISDSVWNTIRP